MEETCDEWVSQSGELTATSIDETTWELDGSIVFGHLGLELDNVSLTLSGLHPRCVLVGRDFVPDPPDVG